MTRALTGIGLIGAAAGLMACGGAGGSGPTTATTPHAPVRQVQPFRAPVLERELGSAFASSLDEWAAIRSGQPQSDLGQRGSGGTVRGVSCRDATTHAWHCVVLWRTLNRRPQRTRYAVRDDGRGCFAASARPPIPSVYSPEAGSMFQDPRDVLVPGLRGC